VNEANPGSASPSKPNRAAACGLGRVASPPRVERQSTADLDARRRVGLERGDRRADEADEGGDARDLDRPECNGTRSLDQRLSYTDGSEKGQRWRRSGRSTRRRSRPRSLPTASGFKYLAATIDWYSRFVVAWRLSNALDGSFCTEMLDEALSRGRPEVFNTGQEVQFTAEAFTGRLESAGVAVSMDGRGRALDNAFVERLWRAVKYEDIYIQGYEEVPELRRGLSRCFAFYNHARQLQALGYRTPAAVYAMPVPCERRLSLPASEG
jgi:putative transposase